MRYIRGPRTPCLPQPRTEAKRKGLEDKTPAPSRARRAASQQLPAREAELSAPLQREGHSPFLWDAIPGMPVHGGPKLMASQTWATAQQGTRQLSASGKSTPYSPGEVSPKEPGRACPRPLPPWEGQRLPWPLPAPEHRWWPLLLSPCPHGSGHHTCQESGLTVPPRETGYLGGRKAVNTQTRAGPHPAGQGQRAAHPRASPAAPAGSTHAWLWGEEGLGTPGSARGRSCKHPRASTCSAWPVLGHVGRAGDS